MMTVVGVSCGGGSGTPGLNLTLPTWITASWVGIAPSPPNPPNDRTDREATEWQGQICPATHLILLYDGNVLNYINDCTIPVTYAFCTTKGVLDNTPACSPDPLETSLSSLRFATILPGALGDFVNASGELAVSFFYCSDQSQIVGGPVRCLN